MLRTGLLPVVLACLGSLFIPPTAQISPTPTDDGSAVSAASGPQRDPVKPVPWGKPRSA